VSSADRTVIRNSRFIAIGIAAVLFGAGMVAAAVVVIASPARTIDNPDGLSGGGRVLTAGACFLVAAVLLVYGVASLRVSLVVNDTGLLIRNPWRTTTVRWESRPRFETRQRTQDVAVQGPITTTFARPRGTITYRYGEIVCVVDRNHIWIAATSRMRRRDRVEQTLKQLRDIAAAHSRPAPSDARDPA